MKTYAIFEIFNYKGGELISRVNLDEDSVCSDLAEKFDGMNFSITEDTTEEEIISHLKIEMADEDFFSTYGGGEAKFCGSIYEVEKGRMIEIRFSSLIPTIAKWMKINWVE